MTFQPTSRPQAYSSLSVSHMASQCVSMWQ